MHHDRSKLVTGVFKDIFTLALHCMHAENSDPMIEPPVALNWAKRPYTGIAISPTPTRSLWSG